MENTVIPIAITTHNRVQFLDTTLRSLSQTLPKDVPVVVYDDGSNSPVMRRYLSTDDVVDLPKTFQWKQDYPVLGATLPPVSQVRGIKNKVEVRMQKFCRGVIANSFRAIRETFDEHPEDDWMILMQDDVIFAADWYDTLATAIAQYRYDGGIIAGCTIMPAHQVSVTPFTEVDTKFVTAQLYAISRNLYESSPKFQLEKIPARTNWDVKMCGLSRNRGLKVILLRPPICQHIGSYSAVRPRIRDDTNRKDNAYVGGVHLAPEIKNLKTQKQLSEVN